MRAADRGSATWWAVPCAICILSTWTVSVCRAGTGISVSPSGHYVVYGGHVRMLIGESGTQVVPMNGHLDLRAWLDRCKAEGHSTVHVWAFTGPRPSDWRLGQGPALLPWVRRTDGTWDLLRFDEGADPSRHYWPRMRSLLRMARDRGLLVGVTVLFGWAKDSDPGLGWEVHPFNKANGGVGARPADVVRIAEDREIHGDAWSPVWPATRKAQWLWEAFSLKLIEAARTFGNVWFDYRDEWSYLNEDAAASEAHWRRFFTARGCIWADRSGEGGLRVANPTVPPFGSTPTMKTEGEPYDPEGIRRESWTRTMSGVHYLLHSDAREPNIALWDPEVARVRGHRPEDDAGRRWVGLCSRFFNAVVRDLDRLVPAKELSQPGVLWMKGADEMVAYGSAGAAPFRAQLAEPHRWFAMIYDPRTGALSPALAQADGQWVTYPAPDPARDWALVLRRR